MVADHACIKRPATDNTDPCSRSSTQSESKSIVYPRTVRFSSSPVYVLSNYERSHISSWLYIVQIDGARRIAPNIWIIQVVRVETRWNILGIDRANLWRFQSKNCMVQITCEERARTDLSLKPNADIYFVSDVLFAMHTPPSLPLWLLAISFL